MVIVCDGSEEADARLRRVLFNDPAMGIVRHAGAQFSFSLRSRRILTFDYISF